MHVDVLVLSGEKQAIDDATPPQKPTHECSIGMHEKKPMHVLRCPSVCKLAGPPILPGPLARLEGSDCSPSLPGRGGCCKG